MSANSTETDAPAKLRVLFCIGVLQPNFDAPREELVGLLEVLKREFGDLRGRYGIEVLGTFDDDMLMVGPSTSFPWTSYILADVPDLDTAVSVCGLMREVEVGEHRLWHYLRIEARIGRALFFGNE
jgi:hypothetical protein